MDVPVKSGDSISNSSWAILLPHFVTNNNDAGIRLSSHKGKTPLCVAWKCQVVPATLTLKMRSKIRGHKKQHFVDPTNRWASCFLWGVFAVFGHLCHRHLYTICYVHFQVHLMYLFIFGCISVMFICKLLTGGSMWAAVVYTLSLILYRINVGMFL